MYVGLHGPGWLYVLGIPLQGDSPLEPPEHVPRTSARAQTCARGPGGLPACHGAESTRKDPRPEEKKMPKGQKNTLIHTKYNMCSVPGMIMSKGNFIPGTPEYIFDACGVFVVDACFFPFRSYRTSWGRWRRSMPSWAPPACRPRKPRRPSPSISPTRCAPAPTTTCSSRYY